MEIEEVATRIRTSSKSVIKVHDLLPVPEDFIAHSSMHRDKWTGCLMDSEGVWYTCPCGAEDHVAFRPFIHDGYTNVGLAQFITCFVLTKQWFINTDVESIVLNEEETYLKLLSQAESICHKTFNKRGVSEETFHFLKDTHGIDRDVAETFLPTNPDTGENHEENHDRKSKEYFG